LINDDDAVTIMPAKILHFRLYLLLVTLVIASESFQNGRSSRKSVLFRERPPAAAAVAPSHSSARIILPPRSSRFVRLLLEQQRQQDTVVVTTKSSTTTTTTTTTATNTTYGDFFTDNSNNNNKFFHLLSLQWTPAEQGGTSTGDHSRTRRTRFSKTVTNVWRWKDVALGDGRDYFVPRPKTLRALQSYLLDQIAAATTAAATSSSSSSSSSSCSFLVKDCVILSNCARFEILLELETRHVVMNNEEENDDIGTMNHELFLTEIISSALLCQIESFQKPRRGSFSASLKLWLPAVDWPGVIDMNAGTTLMSPSSLSNNNAAAASAAASAVKELSQHWTHYTSLECIMQHLSLVAAGLASRPRRPDRAVIFRPFSSRDAHILLQLKRTVDLFGAARRRDNNFESSLSSLSSSLQSSSYLPQLLRFALQAGKAARNPAVVPELEQLRVYGTGDDLKYSSEVPAEVQNRVVEVSACFLKSEKNISLSIVDLPQALAPSNHGSPFLHFLYHIIFSLFVFFFSCSS
jgi:hypothetical protein